MKESSVPILAEDLLLVLFQPGSGMVAAAGENTLSHVLGAAVLAELALDARLAVTATPDGSAHLEAVEGRAPLDCILRSAWDFAADQPRAVEAMLDAIGPTLCQPLLERLVARGDIREENGKALGRLTPTTLKAGESGRRSRLVDELHAVLVGGISPPPRVVALAGLVWVSGTLHQLDPDVPWSSRVDRRAEELVRRYPGAEGATPAAASTTAAMMRIITSLLPPS